MCGTISLAYICREERREREEEFPELLLSSLDQLCLGKQQQLFLVSDVLCFPLCVCACAFSFLCFIAIVLCVCLYVSAFVFVFVGVYFRVRTFDQLCLGKQQQLFL